MRRSSKSDFFSFSNERYELEIFGNLELGGASLVTKGIGYRVSVHCMTLYFFSGFRQIGFLGKWVGV